MDRLARTGRTTRMLEEASRLSTTHTLVIVIAANIRHVRDMLKYFYDECFTIEKSNSTARSQRESAGIIKIRTIHDTMFDQRTMRYRGTDAPVLIDHCAMDVMLLDLWKKIDDQERELRSLREKIDELTPQKCTYLIAGVEEGTPASVILGFAKERIERLQKDLPRDVTVKIATGLKSNEEEIRISWKYADPPYILE